MTPQKLLNCGLASRAFLSIDICSVVTNLTFDQSIKTSITPVIEASTHLLTGEGSMFSSSPLNASIRNLLRRPEQTDDVDTVHVVVVVVVFVVVVKNKVVRDQKIRFSLPKVGVSKRYGLYSGF